MSQYYNPYTGKTFFGFFHTLGSRLWELLTGKLSWSQLASDEIQMIVLLGVAASAALVGTFLVLRKMTMLANSLSHTILIGIVIAFLLTRNAIVGSDASGTLPINTLLLAALGMGIITTFLTEFLTKTARLQEDASTGIVFTTLFALGVTLLTVMTRDAHVGTEVVMGNVDALQLEDCTLVLLVLALNLIIFFAFFKEFTLTTFDAGLAHAFGISPVFFNYLLMTLVSATCVGAFRAVGVLMVLALITGPALMARMLTHHLKTMIAIAIAIGCAASIIGIALSRHILSVHGLALSTGGLVVCVITILFISVIAWKGLTQKRL